MPDTPTQDGQLDLDDRLAHVIASHVEAVELGPQMYASGCDRAALEVLAFLRALPVEERMAAVGMEQVAWMKDDPGMDLAHFQATQTDKWSQGELWRRLYAEPVEPYDD